MRRLSTITIASGVLLVAFSSAALAHFVYESVKVYENSSGSRCLINYTETSHGANGDTGGYSAVRASAYDEESYTRVNCSVPWHRPPKYLRVKWHWLVYKNGQWGSCKYGKWAYSQKTTNQVQITKSRSRPGCGEGYYYGTHGHTEMRINRTDGTHFWVGHPLYSGCHIIPANGNEDSCSIPGGGSH